jgi:hypothetical protein
MAMKNWQESRCYDAALDCDVIRYIAYSGRGSFVMKCKVAAPGFTRREQRDHALYLLGLAINRGDEPGEFPWSDPEP